MYFEIFTKLLSKLESCFSVGDQSLSRYLLNLSVSCMDYQGYSVCEKFNTNICIGMFPYLLYTDRLWIWKEVLSCTLGLIHVGFKKTIYPVGKQIFIITYTNTIFLLNLMYLVQLTLIIFDGRAQLQEANDMMKRLSPSVHTYHLLQHKEMMVENKIYVSKSLVSRLV